MCRWRTTEARWLLAFGAELRQTETDQAPSRKNVGLQHPVVCLRFRLISRQCPNRVTHNHRHIKAGILLLTNDNNTGTERVCEPGSRGGKERPHTH